MIKGPVLVATDLNQGGDEAVRQADSLARHLGGPLHVCHVLPELLRTRMLFPQLQQQDAKDRQALEGKASQALARSVEALTGRSREQYALRLDTGSPHSGILLHAEEVRPGLLVLGAGRVAARVVRYAPCPVLVARPSPSGRVVGATDFSDPSLPAVEAAVSEATRRGVTPCLVHSIDLALIEAGPMPLGFAVPAVTEHVLKEMKATAQRQLEACLTSHRATGECRVDDGPAASAIVRAARELPAELVVVGTRGRTGLARLALGSVAEAVLTDAPCSVLVVRLHEG